MGDAAIYMFRGDSRTLAITVTDSADQPIDLTGAIARFTVRKAIDKEVLISKSSADPAQIDIIDPTNGKLEIYIVPNDTKTLKPGGYVFDVEITLSNGKVYTVVFGNFIVKGDVST